MYKPSPIPFTAGMIVVGSIVVLVLVSVGFKGHIQF